MRGPRPSPPAADCEAAVRAAVARLFGAGVQPRGAQLAAAAAALRGDDALLVAPTGFGKSMCYQALPEAARVLREGRGEHEGVLGGGHFSRAVVVCVTPLLALSADQARSCEEKGLSVARWDSTIGRDKLARTARELVEFAEEEDAAGSPCDVLFATPEALAGSAELRQALRALSASDRILALAVDEAHCVAEWGHDFRPAYLSLRGLREGAQQGGACLAADTPVLALTATATKDVEWQLRECLGLRRSHCLVERVDLNRPNHGYEVFHKEDLRGDDSGDADANAAAMAHLARFVAEQQANGAAGIVYARRRADVERLAGQLEDAPGVELVEGYHAGMSEERRAAILRDFVGGEAVCVVATVAFGMGIDRADVRFVAHFDLPGAASLYQMFGRAGRDGQPAVCRVYVSSKDIDETEKLVKAGGGAEAEAAATFVGRRVRCRRAALLAHFGEYRACAECDTRCDMCLARAAGGSGARPSAETAALRPLPQQEAVPQQQPRSAVRKPPVYAPQPPGHLKRRRRAFVPPRRMD